ncbi:hypothetical protein PSECIP111854_03485 [Pseudoalteromonas sp. CIP111854]|uniref:Uncharacterized protein n=1 Tax=Pseudoalteromonas holothuriae TaxID=2963714 RepID=A0A9W4R2T0_9GAMM|nr:hypothetical protein PSECIP111854_03485 [Pseudoalteromonas sp. CIP111854]
MAYQMGKDTVLKSLRAIYHPLSINPTLVYLPTKRGLQLLNNGEIDADAGRIDKAMAGYTNLIKVPYPLSKFRLFIFCIKPKECVLNKQVGHLIIQGTLLSEQFCQNAQLSCNIVANDISAFSALQKSFAPTLIANDRFAVGTICASGIKEIYARPLTKELKAYHYVHKKHADLVPQLTQSIKKLMDKNLLQNSFQSLTGAAKGCALKVTMLGE